MLQKTLAVRYQELIKRSSKYQSEDFSSFTARLSLLESRCERFFIYYFYFIFIFILFSFLFYFILFIYTQCTVFSTKETSWDEYYQWKNRRASIIASNNNSSNISNNSNGQRKRKDFSPT